MYHGILVDDPFLLCPLPVSFGNAVGGKEGSFKFKGAVDLINLNILDKSVKTL